MLIYKFLLTQEAISFRNKLLTKYLGGLVCLCVYADRRKCVLCYGSYIFVLISGQV